MRCSTNDSNDDDENGVMMRGREDSGETLIEILMTILIISLTVTALLSSLASVGNAGNSQRNGVSADVVVRSYAEAIKTGARACSTGATSYTVTYAAPTGYQPTVTPVGNVCPLAGATQLLQLNVDGPLALRATMQIKIRTP